MTFKKVFFVLIVFLLTTVSQAQEKEWTFLVFVNGVNNLSSFAEMNIRQMEKVGSTEDINVVVEWGSLQSDTAKRLYIEKHNNPNGIFSPVLESMKQHDMGDVNNFIQFVKWGIMKYPAKRYFIAIWNHGTGWAFQPFNILNGLDISLDDRTGNKITTEQMGIALKEIKEFLGRPIDIYGSDACLMQNIEVATEISDHVQFIAGSQDLEPGEGWPYFPFLKKWSENPKIPTEQVAKLLSVEFLKAYSGGVYGRRDVTFSILNAVKLNTFLSRVKDLNAFINQLTADDLLKVKKAGDYAPNFPCSGCADFGVFLKKLKQIDIFKKNSLLDQVIADFNDVIIIKNNSEEFDYATGLSIWIPSSAGDALMPRYQNLLFNQKTNWVEVLKKIN